MLLLIRPLPLGLCIVIDISSVIASIYQQSDWGNGKRTLTYIGNVFRVYNFVLDSIHSDTSTLCAYWSRIGYVRPIHPRFLIRHKAAGFWKVGRYLYNSRYRVRGVIIVWAQNTIWTSNFNGKLFAGLSSSPVMCYDLLKSSCTIIIRNHRRPTAKTYPLWG